MRRHEVRISLPEGIYGITTRGWGFSHESSAQLLLEAGVRIIQYREKGSTTADMVFTAKKLKEICQSYGAVFIVNDRVDVAYASEADGVHLGHEDLPISAAREILGGAVIGASASSVDEGLAAERAGATYIGAGSIFPSSTKPEEGLLGLEGLKRLLTSVKLPVYAIGGIKLEHVKLLKGLGVRGVAVISAIFSARDPREQAKRFVSEWMSS